jgi:hypothetical protein
MRTTNVDSILSDLSLDLNQVAASLRGSSDPRLLPKVEIPRHADRDSCVGHRGRDLRIRLWGAGLA